MISVYSVTDGRLVIGEESALAQTGGQPLWIDLHDPSAAGIAVVEGMIGLRLPSRDTQREIEASKRLSRHGDALVMTLPVLTGATSFEPRNSAVTFILRGSLLVTVRHDAPKAITNYIDDLRQNPEPPGSGGDVFLGLMEAVVERIADVVQGVEDELDFVSHRIFHQHTPDNRRRRAGSRELEAQLRTIGRNGDLAAKARETLLGMKRMVAFLPKGDLGPGGAEGRIRLEVIERDAHSLAEHIDFMANKTNFLLDATLGVIGIQQNQIIKLFTIMSVLFLPPTLVASWYGMNFKVIPELQWDYGYLYAIALAVLTALVPYVVFKRKGWF